MISTKPNGSGIPADIKARFTRQGVGPQAAPQVPKVLQLYPWWLYKPPTGQDIVVLAQNLFAAAGTVELADTVQQLDQNTMAVIRGIDLYVNDLTPTTDATFAFLVNGNPVAGYGVMPIFPRTAASASQSFDCFIFVPAGSRISVQVTNSDGGAYLVGAGYQGWKVPTNIDSILGVDGGAYTGAT
jgi:hypothetical protein